MKIIILFLSSVLISGTFAAKGWNAVGSTVKPDDTNTNWLFCHKKAIAVDATDANFKTTCTGATDNIGNSCCHIKFTNVPKVAASGSSPAAVADGTLDSGSPDFKNYCFGKNGFIALGGAAAANGYLVSA